jgi:hypothetical protein
VTFTERVDLEPWVLNRPGKLLIDVQGTLHCWLVDDRGSPHHDQVAEHLGVRSIADGVIEPSGVWWTSARFPGSTAMGR